MTSVRDAYAYTGHAQMGREFVAPVQFDYTLLSSLYIHHDGSSVLDFSGHATADMHAGDCDTERVKASAAAAQRGACNDGPADGMFASAATARDRRGTYVSMQTDAQAGDSPTHHQTQTQPRVQRRTVSRLVRTENTNTHIWLVSQESHDEDKVNDCCDGQDSDALPATHGALFARNFYTPSELFAYCDDHHMHFPVRCHGANVCHRHRGCSRLVSGAVRAAHEPVDKHQHRRSCEDSKPQAAKWIDIQCARGDAGAARLLRDVLSRFPIDRATLDKCLCLGTQDVVDTDYLTSDAGGYVFLQLMCTPHTTTTSATPASLGSGGPDTRQPSQAAARVKSVMQLRFEAVRDGLPHSTVPNAIPVAVLVFAEWVVTIHEQPFTELDDLLRLVALRCTPHVRAAEERQQATGARDSAIMCSTRFTSTFVFASIMQIVVGHHLDSVALARAVDDLGDAVFDVQPRLDQQDRVLRRITAVRRCFGECSADVNRRESIVAQLLQPQLADNFLLRDACTRQQLEQALAHLRYVLHELEDCRDAVAMSSWYHNIALHWTMLRSGNSALRQLLQMTEIANVVFPVFIIQTLYSMNVKLPFQYSDDPPYDSMIPFYLLAGLMAAYTIACLPAILRIFRRKRFATRLLA